MKLIKMKRPKVVPRIGKTRLLLLLTIIGPGIISGSADNDAPGISTYSAAGGRFGYGMLWMLLLITLTLAVTQEMGARMGLVTGQSLSALIREKFSIRLTLFAVSVMLIADWEPLSVNSPVPRAVFSYSACQSTIRCRS